ncbi:uncharacterized protein [Epargyreus clarus]|uniref:uncharacterized protein isoform X2 n=1 Tax=Epargyreus clarus TaxID=520877 RepID=UPI003C2BBC55
MLLKTCEDSGGRQNRYLGLPVMLKAGEYSPNNPLVRGERPSGDALLGLGEYERRRNTLRKMRQRQYREYLDQQAKLKQEAKEKAERERREREERDRLQEERERERELERDRYSPERRRASVNYTQVSGANNAYTTKVDTGVQVNNISKPLSVAVQTDEQDLFRLSPTPKNLLMQAERELSPRTVVDSRDDRPIHPASWALREGKDWKDIDWKEGKHWNDPSKEWKEPGDEWKEPGKEWKEPGEEWKEPGKEWKEPAMEWKEPGKEWKEPGKEWKDPKDWNELRKELESKKEWNEHRQERRRSYGDFDERAKRESRDRASESRTYKPSIFDADAIELRNLQVEKEAAARRQFYQQELKNQILEQQRIREERKNREKMLEQAEMRRLEQQLRTLRAAHEREADRQHRFTRKIKDDEIEYDRKRTTLQQEIDLEHQSLLRARTLECANVKRIPQTSKSDTYPSKLPFYYPKTDDKTERVPYSTNIPDNSVFSANYDVESYLRRNLNPTRQALNSNRLDKEYNRKKYTDSDDDNRNVVVEKALVHDRPKTERKIDRSKLDKIDSKIDYETDSRDQVVESKGNRSKIDRAKSSKNYNKIDYTTSRSKIDVESSKENRSELKIGLKDDPLPIPILRHSPKPRSISEHEKSNLSEAMRVVDDKWKVPVVQKNILKSLPNEEGKSVSILTQLGSIRRQLQLEQLKLDKMLSKDSDV